MDYKSMQIGDIIAWCKANGQTAWLKAEAAKQVPCKVFPKVVVDGKKVADKSAEPKIEMRPITFIQIKTDFVNAFMPEIAPKKKEKKPTMYELIAAL
jgi:hypothetical protein